MRGFRSNHGAWLPFEPAGHRQIAVLVNKMDFRLFAGALRPDREGISCLPGSIGVQPRLHPDGGQARDNIASLSANMPWWTGPTVLATLDEFKVAEMPKDQPLRFPFRTCIDSMSADPVRAVESGSIKVGDRLIFSPTTRRARQNDRTLERPIAGLRLGGESIGLTLTEQIFVERGSVAALETAPPYELNRFKARFSGLAARLSQRKSYKLKLATRKWIVKSRASKK